MRSRILPTVQTTPDLLLRNTPLAFFQSTQRAQSQDQFTSALSPQPKAEEPSAQFGSVIPVIRQSRWVAPLMLVTCFCFMLQQLSPRKDTRGEFEKIITHPDLTPEEKWQAIHQLHPTLKRDRLVAETHMALARHGIRHPQDNPDVYLDLLAHTPNLIEEVGAGLDSACGRNPKDEPLCPPLQLSCCIPVPIMRDEVIVTEDDHAPEDPTA